IYALSAKHWSPLFASGNAEVATASSSVDQRVAGYADILGLTEFWEYIDESDFSRLRGTVLLPHHWPASKLLRSISYVLAHCVFADSCRRFYYPVAVQRSTENQTMPER
ncbi:hypothetical protein AB6846_09615, partial [Serratia proteamaculans]